METDTSQFRQGESDENEPPETFIKDWQCEGMEENLLDCSGDERTGKTIRMHCDLAGDVGVYCFGKYSQWSLDY